MNTREIGTKYESVAAEYLEKKGYVILERNFRGRAAEADIVAKDGDTYVFVEVKYRESSASGHPLEAVTYAKQKKVSAAAVYYMSIHKLAPDATSIRFDVIGIKGEEITHIENAFYYAHARVR